MGRENPLMWLGIATKDSAPAQKDPTRLEAARSEVLSVVTNQTPAQQTWDRMQADVGVALATTSCVVDFVVSFPFVSARWRQQIGDSPHLWQTHMQPFLFGHCGVGFSAWNGLGWTLVHDVVYSLVSCGIFKNRPWLVLDKPIAAVLSYPITMIQFDSIASGASVGLHALSSFGWARPSTISLERWQLLIVGSVLHTIARDTIRNWMSAQHSPHPDGKLTESECSEKRNLGEVFIPTLSTSLFTNFIATVGLLPLETAVLRLQAEAAGVTNSGAQDLLVVPGYPILVLIAAEFTLRLGVLIGTGVMAGRLLKVLDKVPKIDQSVSMDATLNANPVSVDTGAPGVDVDIDVDVNDDDDDDVVQLTALADEM
eukprot:m.61572 g.61572  ORF g.61572 m.61572 type:complete len:370 (-) comp23008_c0_seq2:421-1530(-)